jgi:segregation and condensation protein B
VEECGRLELPGKPLLYGTTKNFLRCFSLGDLSELPPLPKDNSGAEADDLGEQLTIDE